MNTLRLIDQWSMAGAEGDLDGWFGSAPDFRALPQSDEPTEAPLNHVLLKRAGEEEWLPLTGGNQTA